MARPKEFDREQALMSAVHTFWARGYGGTSVQNLVDSMGIHRASLYDTFGSKQALFEEVLRRYNEHLFATLFAPLLDAERPPLQRLNEFFDGLAEALCGSMQQGCLVAKSALAPDEDLEPLRGHLTGFTDRLDGTFASLLESAIQNGDLGAETDVPSLARHLRNTLFGLTISAAIDRDPERLREMVRWGLAVVGSGAPA